MMPVFKTISDDDPLLLTSPIVRGVMKTAKYIDEHEGISLTKSGAFNRSFVHWAAAEFDWPGYSEEDLFSVNKVLNEWDFPAVEGIHVLLKELKLGRHFKGKFLLTKAGKELIAHPARVMSQLIPDYLFRMDHGGHLREEEQIPGNWNTFLNIINVEADHGASLTTIRETLYGEPNQDSLFDRIGSVLYVTVLRPLCWAGLLTEESQSRRSSDRMFRKTDLWRRTLRLETDRDLRPRILH